MTTLPPPSTNEFPQNSVEKQVYEIVNKFEQNIPRMNDRNRLGYTLYKYMIGEGDPPEVLVKTTKIQLEGITQNELANKLTEELKSVKK
jgi:hypothetical protein